MPALLEVIVTSTREATEAELGGADRLEFVRALEQGGLTPDLHAVRETIRIVSIPVRVMLRETASYSISNSSELQHLRAAAKAFAQLSLDGLVLGFVESGKVDVSSLGAVLDAAPSCRVTFHRAFEAADDPLEAIATLKRFPQIDRILTNGGTGSCNDRIQRLHTWQRAAAPEIKILAGAGLCARMLSCLRQDTLLSEVHVGRAARFPHAVSGIVDRAQVASVKSELA